MEREDKTSLHDICCDSVEKGCCCDDDCCCEDEHCHDDDCCCGDDDCCCDDDDCCCEHEHVHHEHVRDFKPTFTFDITGLDCPNCAAKTEHAIQDLECVKDARLIYATAKLEVQKTDDAKLSHCKEHVIQTVRSCAHDVRLTGEDQDSFAEQSWWKRNRQKVLLGASGVFLLAGLIGEFGWADEKVANTLYIVSAVLGLLFILPQAIAALRRKTADMNVLMSIAVIGALCLGFAGDTEVFRDAAIVIFLDQVGEWLEGWSMRKTSSSIQELYKLAPEIAHVVQGDKLVDEPVAAIAPGTLVKVLPGERICLDGVISEGATSINEAPVTGESLAKDKSVGDEVYAGTLNLSQSFVMKTTAAQAESTLSKIVRQVETAQASKAPYQTFVDRFAAVYTPVVVASAAVVGLAIPAVLILLDMMPLGVWHDWIYRALSLLVVACPCALVISTPISFVSAITAAAKHGVLVKGGSSLDIASRTDTVALDKTGTITSGNLHVLGFETESASKDELLRAAASLEAESTHPIAKSIVAFAREQGVEPAHIVDASEKPGFGVSGRLDNTIVAIGKKDFVSDSDVSESLEQKAASFFKEGASVLYLSVNGVIEAVVGIADTIRPEAIEAIASLRKDTRISEVLMLTGDGAKAAHAIASECGIDQVKSELLPGNKAQVVEELHHQGHIVAMVGDGINDAPALAASDLAVTMGAASSDTAAQVADVALLSDDLLHLSGFFGLAQHTMRVVRENIGCAIGIKVLVFILVIMGRAGMGAAVFADTGVAVLVILNGMRLMLDSHLNRK